MPNKLFEHLKAMKPVVVSPTLEQRRLVERCRVGVVAKDTSPEGVRAAVIEMLAQELPKLREAIGVARAEYCWERQEIKLKEIYMHGFGYKDLRPQKHSLEQPTPNGEI